MMQLRFPSVRSHTVLILLLIPSISAQTNEGVTATSIRSFEGIEEPAVCYQSTQDTFEKDSFINITDVGDNTIRMTLRYRKGTWWDGDRVTNLKDRQRAEVKGLGPHQKEGETFEYGTTWRTNPEFQATDRFCHVFQLKATDGDNAPPLVVLSVIQEQGMAAVRYWAGDAKGFTIARKFPWKPATWQSVRIRIKTAHSGGGVTASVDGDAFVGTKDIPLYRPQSTKYRPKWGLYRGVTANMAIGDDYVEHRNAFARKEQNR